MRNQPTGRFLLTLCIMLVLAACSPITPAAQPGAASPVEAPPTAPARSPAESDPLLSWQGTIDGACHDLRVWADGVAQAGVCGDAPSVTAQLLSPATEWEAIKAHFGSIEAETPHGTITFAATGPQSNTENNTESNTATGEIWANALAIWAEFAAMETLSGQPSAAGRTTLAWQMDEIADQPGRCAQLIVLAYGYAYANQIACEGNAPSTQVGQGWLTDEEMATFTTWMNEHSRLDDAAGYVDTTGDAPLGSEAIDPFAAAAYDRLFAAGAGT